MKLKAIGLLLLVCSTCLGMDPHPPTTEPPDPVLWMVKIVAPEVIEENSVVMFTSIALYSDNTTQIIEQCNWDLGGLSGVVDSNGVFYVGSISTNVSDNLTVTFNDREFTVPISIVKRAPATLYHEYLIGYNTSDIGVYHYLWWCDDLILGDWEIVKVFKSSLSEGSIEVFVDVDSTVGQRIYNGTAGFFKIESVSGLNLYNADIVSLLLNVYFAETTPIYIPHICPQCGGNGSLYSIAPPAVTYRCEDCLFIFY